MDILKLLTIFALTILAFTFVGCSALEPTPFDHPIIIEYGPTGGSSDDSRIEIYSAKPGIQGINTVETDNGIEVTLYYDKR